jgi:hypothetical protein
MENKTLSSTLELIMRLESQKLVGKVCKRIELINITEKDSIDVINAKIDSMKSNIKELIYEWTRDLKDMVSAGEVKILFEIKQTSKE